MLRIEWTQETGALAAIEADVSQHEGHEITSEVTEHAVERGSDISDHAKPSSGNVTLEGIISNHPIVVPSTQMDGVTGKIQSVSLSQGGSASVLRFSAAFDRMRAVDRLIQDLIATSTIVRIVTHLRDYDEMILTRFRVDLDAASGNSLPFVLDAKKLRLVETQRVQVPRPAERRGQTTRQRGNQPPTPTPRVQSVLARTLDAALGR